MKKVYSISGLSKTAEEWSHELHVGVSTFQRRWYRYINGTMPIEHLLHNGAMQQSEYASKHNEASKICKPYGTRLYRAWHHIGDDGKDRICEEWRTDFCSFRDWAKANGYNEDEGIVYFHRRDKNKDWSPNNTYISGLSGDNHVMLTHNGETMSLCDWARRLGMSKQKLSARIQVLKWSVDRALTEG